MKVTVEIDDDLHREAKAFAREHGTTLRELVESGLTKEVEKYTREVTRGGQRAKEPDRS